MIKKIQIDDVIYDARVDFRTVIRCNEISEDKTIGDFERGLAIIYMVYGSNGLEHAEHYEKLLRWALNYFSCGEQVHESYEKPDMDYTEDMDYIEASFMSDYHIDLENEDMSWHKFHKLLNGLSNSETGNCCVLNRIRNLRNFDLSEIKDAKQKDKIRKAQRQVALKKYQLPKKEATEEQLKSAEEFYKALERS